MMLLKVDFNPVSEFTDFVHNPYVDLPLGLDINKAVVYLWMAAAVAIVTAHPGIDYGQVVEKAPLVVDLRGVMRDAHAENVVGL